MYVEQIWKYYYVAINKIFARKKSVVLIKQNVWIAAFEGGYAIWRRPCKTSEAGNKRTSANAGQSIK